MYFEVNNGSKKPTKVGSPQCECKKRKNIILLYFTVHTFLLATLTIIRKEKKYPFIYVYNLNFFDEITKKKIKVYIVSEEKLKKKKTEITINSPNN